MTALGERIRAQIAATGPISVADYMALCLSDPRDGYYMSRDPFGQDGDFTTAPEISQMFGEIVAAWLATAWQMSGRPGDPLLVEIGPGRGTLMRDMLRTLARAAPAFLAEARVFLVETSPRLRAMQAATLGDAASRVTWVDRLDALPAGPLVIVGNELFDAIPARQFVMGGGRWRERVVSLDQDGALTFGIGAASVDAALVPDGVGRAKEGDVIEVAPARAALMQTIAERIAGKGGCGLFIDYGHLASGLGDTLQAVRRHGPEPVFDSPGEADLTTHVDFAALASVVRRAGLDAPMTTQGDFLLKCGLLDRAGRLGAAGDNAARERLRADVERLAAPGQMGDLFKVLAILPRGVAAPPFG
jgi:SAM-dependent MidA family methyltransferase